MKKRYIYSILFGVPGLLISALLSLIVAGTAAGALWIFVFGDNPWPASVETILPVMILAVFLVVWIAILAAGFFIGKRLERDPVFNKGHILVSIGVIVAFLLGFTLFQLRIGNIGPRSESLVCSDYCSQKGYSASSESPQNLGNRTCSCLGQFGNEILTVPMESLNPTK
jgi:hypothetical protein